MADELKENVTTPWMQNELTAEEINRDDNAGENTGFWILRGKGSGRDRFISLKNLRTWIQAAVDAIAYIKDNGIDGIKKAFKFADESTHHALDIDANGVIITHETDTFSVFADGKKLHFDGDSVFSSNVEFAADVDCTGEINVRDGSKTIQATLGKDIYAKGAVSCDGAVHSIEGMSSFDKISASGDVKVNGDLVCDKDVGAKGNVAVGGKLSVNGVVDSKLNSMSNLKIQQRGDSTDEYVMLSSGAVFATGSVTARQVVVEPIEGEGFKIDGSLRVQRNAIGLYELMFYNGSAWVKVG